MRKGNLSNEMKRLFFYVLASLLISTSIPSMASANSTTSLVNTARAYIGTPYSYGGTTTSGFDCSGYTQFVFKKAWDFHSKNDWTTACIWEHQLPKSELKQEILSFSTQVVKASHMLGSISDPTTSSMLHRVKAS